MALDRYEMLRLTASRVPEDALVMATYIGAVGFEWADLTENHPRTALLGQMGDVIGLAVGLAIALPHRPVLCIDGDGSVLMELGQLVVMGQERPPNLTVLVVDNGCYESIGWGPGGRRATATAANVDLAAIASGAGVPNTCRIETMDELEATLEHALHNDGCTFIDVVTSPGRAHVGPRQVDGFEDKYRFIRYVERLEGIDLLRLAQQDRRLLNE